MKKIFTKNNLIRALLFIGSVSLILWMLPRPDHHSYSFELNQPWRYPLLTAPFDIPVMPDSTSIRQRKDSVDNAFIPFVQRDDAIARNSIEAFAHDLASQDYDTHVDVSLVQQLMQMMYNQGILESNTYKHLVTNHLGSLRTTARGGDNNISQISANGMVSPRRAYEIIDSIYSTMRSGQNLAEVPLDKYLVANIVDDKDANTKYKNMEYLNVSGARGVIKQGQRIVDRGEIVTPQVFTNLHTYEEMMQQQKNDSRKDRIFVLGQALYLILCMGIMFLFLHIYRSRFFDNMRQMTFLVSFLTLFALFALMMVNQFTMGIYLVPFAAVPIIITVFFDARTAIFALMVEVLICAVAATFQFQFVFVELMVGIVATYSISQLSRRSQLLRTALLAFLVYCVAYGAVMLVNDGNLEGIRWRLIGVFGINAVILSFAYVLIFVIEKIFGFTSTVTLVELSDINNPLLRRLAEEAPGTFQHSMQVSTLAAEGARAIGANTQLVRTGALYHDIGKLQSPIFFTENQHGVNPHDGLDPETSAKKITSHISAGLQIAGKNKLPNVIKDFIREHHGSGMARYFYNTAVNTAGGDTSKVDKSKFEYPGPDPRSKETAILMMADAVEAASRSLKDYSPQSISDLVENIVNGQLRDGRFNDAPISLREIEKVKQTFKKRLANIYHTRIAYPKLEAH